MKEVLLYSGGIDSFIAWHYLGKPDRLYVGLGHKYMKQEIERVIKSRMDGTLHMIFMDSIGSFEKEDAEIPMRNLYLVMIAVNLGYDKIYLISQKDEMSIPDRSDRFYGEASDFLTYLNGRPILVDTPFWEMDKTDMVDWYIRAGGDVELLKETWACHKPVEDKECGDCGACFRKYVAFKNNGIDPGFKLSERIKEEYRRKMNTYSKERQERMRPWL